MISNFERDGPLYHSMRYQDKQISVLVIMITIFLRKDILSDNVLHYYSPSAYSGFVNISRTAEYFTACYTVLKGPNKVETAVHGCNLAFSLDSIVSLPR